LADRLAFLLAVRLSLRMSTTLNRVQSVSNEQIKDRTLLGSKVLKVFGLLI
jgi:hypothetical protein